MTDCLLARFQASWPTPQRSIYPEEVGHRFNRDVVNIGSKYLYPGEYEGKLRSITNSARQLMEKWTNACPILAAHRILSPVCRGQVEEGLADLRDRFFESRDELLSVLVDTDLQYTQGAAWLAQAEMLMGDSIGAVDKKRALGRARELFDREFNALIARGKDAFGWSLEITGPVVLEDLARAMGIKDVQGEVDRMKKSVLGRIRGRMLARLRDFSHRYNEGPKTNEGVPRCCHLHTLQRLRNQVELSELTNPFGDPEVEPKVRKFTVEWLEDDLGEVAAQLRDDETTRERFREAVDDLAAVLEQNLEPEDV